MPSQAQPIVTALFGGADIRMDGARPWDLRVHDERFFPRVLAAGTLGFGEAYMDGWWDCDALDEMCCRASRARLDERPVAGAKVEYSIYRSRYWFPIWFDPEDENTSFQIQDDNGDNGDQIGKGEGQLRSEEHTSELQSLRHLV